jgi:hypothetical protein
MRRRDLGNYVLLGLIALTVVVYFAKSLRKRSNEVNLHDPGVGRIDAFALQPGEVGVTLRVRHKSQPAAASVWAQRGSEEDEDPPPLRTGQSDASGMVRVPIVKGGGATRLFARDGTGRVAGATLSSGQLLSAPDLVLVDVAPRAGRLVTDAGAPIAGASLVALFFSTVRPGAEGESTSIEIPGPVQKDYTVKTDAEGRFTVPGVPLGFLCRLTFQTSGFGQGNIWLPADGGECLLAPGGAVRVRVSGDGTATDVRGLRCRLFDADQANPRPDQVRVDGQRTLRHDGSADFVIGNVVPGKYRVQVEGTPRNPVLPEQALTVAVAAGQRADAGIVLKRAGQVVGRALDGKTGTGVPGVRFGVFAVNADSGYGGYVVTRDDGRFSAYVPAGAPVAFAVDRCPKPYAVPTGRVAALFTNTNTVTAAAGETKTTPDTKLYAQGSIGGVVVAEGRPVPGAMVEVAWDVLQNRRPVSVKTDEAGRFEVANVPPGLPVTLRVRAFNMVNARVVFAADDLVGPLTIPIAAEHAFRVRGKVSDARRVPVERAKVVITGTVRARAAAKPQAVPADGAPVPPVMPEVFQPVEVEAVFTDAAGGFESGPLWPECNYTLAIAHDGLLPQQVRDIESHPGQTRELTPLVLHGTAAAVAGLVVGTDGTPLPGATVINSGDSPRWTTATTDARGRFTLTGLYDGQAVIVTHKAGYRWSYAVVRPGDPEPKMALPAEAEPPVPLAPVTADQQQAEATLVRRLTELVEKEKAKLPKPAHVPDSSKSELEQARTDLDGYLAAQTKKTTMGSSVAMVRVAQALAKDDRPRALRVLQAAATVAKQSSMPAHQGFGFLSSSEISAVSRAQELIGVAEASADLGFREQAVSWLAETETSIARLAPKYRRQPLQMLAVAWATLDPTHTEHLLKEIGPDRDMAIHHIISRLLQSNVQQAAQWLERLQRPDEREAQRWRALVAARLAPRDLAQALRLAEGVHAPVYQSQMWGALARIAHRTDVKRAHAFIDKAAAALVLEPKDNDRQQRLGQAIALLWQAKGVGYPDLASLVAIALTTRAPVPIHAQAGQAWRSQTLMLAAGVASVDPAAGRALLGPGGNLGSSDDPEENAYVWLTPLALSDPAAALSHLDSLRDFYASVVLAILQQRSAVGLRLGLGGDWPPEDQAQEEP